MKTPGGEADLLEDQPQAPAGGPARAGGHGGRRGWTEARMGIGISQIDGRLPQGSLGPNPYCKWFPE